MNFQEFNENIWLIVNERIGYGTGYNEIEQVWYNIKTKNANEEFRFTALFTFFYENYSYDTLFEQKITKIDVTDDNFVIELCSNEKIYANKDKDFLISEKNNVSSYQYFNYEINNLNFFSTKNSAIHTGYDSDESFFLNNYNSLLNLAYEHDELKKEWLLNFINNQTIYEKADKIRKLIQ